MTFDDFMEEPYEPDDDEKRELDEILKEENNKNRKIVEHKNRLVHIFYTESHFSGWLRTNGIRW